MAIIVLAALAFTFPQLRATIAETLRQYRLNRAFRIASRRNPPETVKLGNHAIRSEIVITDNDLFQKLTLESGGLLPPPVEIAGSVAAPADKDPAGADMFKLDTGDFAALNELIGRPLLNAELEDDLKRLARHCCSFSIFNNRIGCLITLAKLDKPGTEELRRVLARIADRFLSIRKSVDLRFHLLDCRLRRLADQHGQIAALRQLLRFYQNQAMTGPILERLQRSRDFEIAVTAAQALGRDPAAFTEAWFGRVSTGKQCDAVKTIRELKLTACLEFLLRYFPLAPTPGLKHEMILAFRDFAVAQAEPLILEELKSGYQRLKDAIVEALRTCGGRDSLEPLYRISKDDSLLFTLRDRAEAALAMIRSRLGPVDAGLLSLTTGEQGEGGLSLAERAGEGNLSLDRSQSNLDGDRS